jgi:hypothetical protein
MHFHVLIAFWVLVAFSVLNVLLALLVLHVLLVLFTTYIKLHFLTGLAQEVLDDVHHCFPPCCTSFITHNGRPLPNMILCTKSRRSQSRAGTSLARYGSGTWNPVTKMARYSQIFVYFPSFMLSLFIHISNKPQTQVDDHDVQEEERT